MPLSQFKIEVLGRDRTITALYNPEEYTVAKDNNFSVQGVPGLNSPVVQFVHGNQRTLEVELLCDSWDTPFLPKRDVREQTQPIVDLMRIDGGLHAPPLLRVKMASLRMDCVLSRVSEQFTMLLPDGMPVRARLSCTFLEVVDPEHDAIEANLLSTDLTSLHVVMHGDTLSSIAAARYDDPGTWRPIALANGIADPMTVAVGQTLRVPSLPFPDPETGEAVA
jgi:Contractile injection system tube protein/LysM domain